MFCELCAAVVLMIQLLLDPKKTPLQILCLGSHCDDIEIGCGGTLLKLIQSHRGNVMVQWVVFSSTPEREEEAQRSAQAFLKRTKQKNVVIQHFADSFFPYNGGEIKKFMQELSRRFSPDVIFTHYRNDLHQDHRLIAELTWNAFRDHWILEYEVPKYDGDLGSPNLFVSLTGAMCHNKINHVVRYYKSQRNKRWFTKETFLSLHRLRGIECNSASGYAEAFYCRKTLLG
jgi:LmbE family N-acetylglucosaminyl deacetylase